MKTYPQPMPNDIIQRLIEGFYFYEFHEERNKAMKKILSQNIEFSESEGKEKGICKKI